MITASIVMVVGIYIHTVVSVMTRNAEIGNEGEILLVAINIIIYVTF